MFGMMKMMRRCVTFSKVESCNAYVVALGLVDVHNDIWS